MSDKKPEQKGTETPVTSATPVVMSVEAMLAMAKELRRDPEKEAELEAKRLHREEIQKMHASACEVANNRWKYCSTGHKKQDRVKWNISWMMYKDKIARGYCAECQTLFEPGHPQYEGLLLNSSFNYDLSPIG